MEEEGEEKDIGGDEEEEEEMVEEADEEMEVQLGDASECRGEVIIKLPLLLVATAPCELGLSSGVHCRLTR